MAAIPLHPAAHYYQRLSAIAAQNSADTGAMIETELVFGMYSLGRAQWSDVHKHLSASARLADQIGNSRQWSEAQYMLTVGLNIEGKWQETRNLSQEIYTRNLRYSDRHLQAAGLTSLGITMSYEQGGEQAAELLKQSYDLLQQTNDPSGVANVLGALAQNYGRQGLLEMAEKYLRQFLALPGVETPTAVYVVTGYWGAAETALTLLEMKPSGDYLGLAKQALHALRSYGHIYDCGHPFALLHDGWLAWLENDERRALRLGQQAVNSAQHIAAPYAEGLAYYHLGKHLPAEDRRRVGHLQKAEALFGHLGAAYNLAQTREELVLSAGSISTL